MGDYKNDFVEYSGISKYSACVGDTSVRTYVCDVENDHFFSTKIMGITEDTQTGDIYASFAGSNTILRFASSYPDARFPTIQRGLAVKGPYASSDSIIVTVQDDWSLSESGGGNDITSGGSGSIDSSSGSSVQTDHVHTGRHNNIAKQRRKLRGPHTEANRSRGNNSHAELDKKNGNSAGDADKWSDTGEPTSPSYPALPAGNFTQQVFLRFNTTEGFVGHILWVQDSQYMWVTFESQNQVLVLDRQGAAVKIITVKAPQVLHSREHLPYVFVG